MAKIEFLTLWVGSILAVITSHSIPLILSSLASISIIIAHWDKVIKTINNIFKKK